MPIFKLSEKKDKAGEEVIAGIRLTESDYVNPNTARIDLKDIRKEAKTGIPSSDLGSPENLKDVLEAATQEVPKDIENKDMIDIPPSPPSPDIPSDPTEEIILPPIGQKPTSPPSTLKPPSPAIPSLKPPVTEDKKEDKPEAKPPENKEKLNIPEPGKPPSAKVQQTSPASTLTLKTPTMDEDKPVFDSEPETQVSALPDEVLNKLSEDKKEAETNEAPALKPLTPPTPTLKPPVTKAPSNEDKKDSETSAKPPVEDKLKLPEPETLPPISLKDPEDDKGKIPLPKKDDTVTELKKPETDDSSEIKLPTLGDKPTSSQDAPPLKPLTPPVPTLKPPVAKDKEETKLPPLGEKSTPSDIPTLKPPTAEDKPKEIQDDKKETESITKSSDEDNKIKLPDDNEQSSPKKDKPETDEDKKDDAPPMKKKFPMGTKKPMGKMPLGKKPFAGFGKKPLGKKPLGAFGKKPLGKKPLGAFGKKPLGGPPSMGEKKTQLPGDAHDTKTPVDEKPSTTPIEQEAKLETKPLGTDKPIEKDITATPEIPTLKPPVAEENKETKLPSIGGKPTPPPGIPTLKPPTAEDKPEDDKKEVQPSDKPAEKEGEVNLTPPPATPVVPTLKTSSPEAQTMILPAVGAKPAEDKAPPNLGSISKEKDKAPEVPSGDDLQVPTAKIPAYERADKTAITPKVPTRAPSASLYCFFKIAGSWKRKHYLSTDHGVRIGGADSLNEITLNDEDLDKLQVVIIEVGDKWVAMDTGPKDMMRVDGTASRQVTLSPNLPFVLQIGSESVVALLSDTGDTPELIPATKKPDAAPGAIQLSKVKCGEKEFPVHIPETLPAGESKEISGLDKTGFTLTPINDPERILQALKIPITGGSLHVGRSSKTSDLLVPDKNVSRQHAKVTIQGKTLLIEDCETSNGTFLNSEEITDPTTVCAGDTITFGSNPFIVSFQ